MACIHITKSDHLRTGFDFLSIFLFIVFLCFFTSFFASKLNYTDIAKPHFAAVFLKQNRAGLGPFLLTRAGLFRYFHIIMYQNSVVQYRDAGVFTLPGIFAFPLEPSGPESNLVALPLARFPAGVLVGRLKFIY